MISDNFTELWDIYDKNLHKIGTKHRYETLDPGEFHLVVNAFIFSNDNHVLLQQRSVAKLNHPQKWDCSAGGSALVGEDGCTAIIREINEELGLNVNPEQTTFILRNEKNSWVEDWFAIKIDFKVDQLKLQSDEVQQVNLFDRLTAQEKLTRLGVRPYVRELKKAFAAVIQKNE